MAKPKLALVPSTIGTKVYSVLPSDGDGDFTFTRATKATRINSLGLIEEVLETRNRLNYSLLDGKVQECPHLLLEPARTNLVKYSESFSQSYWTKSGSSIASNNAISPDGTQNASKLVEGTNNGLHWMYSGAIPVTNATKYSISVFAKKGERNSIRIAEKSGIAVIVNLEDKVFDTIGSGVLSSNITELTNDWVKIDYSFQTTSTIEEIYIYAADNGVINYQGDGSKGIYTWGVQLEAGTYPTSYIKSNSNSTTTRNAETAVNSGSASTFNDSEGVLMAEISALDSESTNKMITISNGSNSTRVLIRYVGTTLLTQLRISGANQYEFGYDPTNIKDNFKIAFKYKANDFSFFVNGFELNSSNSGSTFSDGTLTELAFDDGGGSNDFYGKTKQVQYFDSVLSESQIEELTSWVSFREMANGQGYIIE